MTNTTQNIATQLRPKETPFRPASKDFSAVREVRRGVEARFNAAAKALGYKPEELLTHLYQTTLGHVPTEQEFDQQAGLEPKKRIIVGDIKVDPKTETRTKQAIKFTHSWSGHGWAPSVRDMQKAGLIEDHRQKAHQMAVAAAKKTDPSKAKKLLHTIPAGRYNKIDDDALRYRDQEVLLVQKDGEGKVVKQAQGFLDFQTNTSIGGSKAEVYEPKTSDKIKEFLPSEGAIEIYKVS